MAKHKIGAPTPEKIDDMWQRKAAAASIIAVRELVAGGVIPPATPISRLSDSEWGWFTAAILFAWMPKRTGDRPGLEYRTDVAADCPRPTAMGRWCGGVHSVGSRQSTRRRLVETDYLLAQGPNGKVFASGNEADPCGNDCTRCRRRRHHQRKITGRDAARCRCRSWRTIGGAG